MLEVPVRKKMTNKLEVFTQTSDELYENHDYRIVSFDNTSIVLDNYQDVFLVWRSTPVGVLSHVEVLDKKNKKRTKIKKGFG